MLEVDPENKTIGERSLGLLSFWIGVGLVLTGLILLTAFQVTRVPGPETLLCLVIVLFVTAGIGTSLGITSLIKKETQRRLAAVGLALNLIVVLCTCLAGVFLYLLYIFMATH
jgi:hypothetical protein